MKRSAGLRKYENCILVLTVMAVNVLLMGLFFDFYYDLNDDALMHDIMSGVYTGTPDGHNMQTLYPLGAFLALLYRICRPVPWYGLFLCLCQFGSLYLIGVRLCGLRDGAAGKLLWLALLSLFQWGIWLNHLVDVQYTITCAMLAAAALFLFLTTPEGLDTKQFIVKSIAPVVLALVAYMLRTEMFLLSFPLVCLAGFCRLTAEKKIFDRDNLIRYGTVFASVLTGMLLLTAADCAAYGSEDWQDFRRFFDARTKIYDYYPELITDDRYREELTRLGVTGEQQQLLRNYDFGLDETIDTQMLERLADYAGDAPEIAGNYAAIAPEVLKSYLYRTTHGGVGGDAPYNAFVLWAYAAVFAAGMAARRRRREPEKNGGGDEGRAAGLLRRYDFVWQLALLAFVRSALWLFILFRGRDPERITHSLYLLEFALLAALAVRLCRAACDRERGKGRGLLWGITAVFAVLAAVSLPDSVQGVRGDQEQRAEINREWYAIDAYCREREACFYFEDVYSTVRFSRRLFAERGNDYANYDIVGGWNCKSPLYDEKLARCEIQSAADALLDRDDVYLIVSRQECDSVLRAFTDYYAAQGIGVQAEQTDAIGEQYGVWRFMRTAEEGA